MMKLVQNELIKLWKQTGIKVLMIILAALMIIIPVLGALADGLLGSIVYYDDYSLEDEIEWMEELIESSGKYENDAHYERAMVEAYRFFLGNGWDYGSWQFDYFGDKYCRLRCEIYALRLIADGTDARTVIEEYGLYDLVDDENSPYGKINYSGDDYESIFTSVTPAQVKEYLAKLEAEIAGLEEQLKTDEIGKAAIEEELADCIRMRERYLNAAKDYREQAESESGIDYDMLYCAQRYEKSAEYCADQEKIIRSVVDAGGGIDDWRVELFESLYQLPLSYYKEFSVPMPRELIAQDSYYHENQAAIDKAYEDAVEKAENYDRMYNELMSVIVYAAENDIPFSSLSPAPAKSEFRSNLGLAFGIVLIFSVVVASQIMSREYSSGTIRMLVIRPKKRHKIVTSKLIALLITILTCMLASVLIQTAMGLIFNGVGDMFTPDLAYRNGRVVEIPAALTYAKIFGLSLLTTIFFTSLAFMLSVFMKHSAVAITVAIILYFAASIVQSIVFSICSYKDIAWMPYTVLPYLDLSVFCDTYSDYVSNMMGSMTVAGISGTSYYSMYTKFIPWVGCIIVAAHTALLTFISYITFIKKQIKS